MQKKDSTRFKQINITCSGLVLLFSAGLLSQAALAHTDTLKKAIGKNATVMLDHTVAKTAPLKIVSIQESKQHALKKKDRIAGYPSTAKQKKIAKKKSRQLAKLMMDDKNYAHIIQRCGNKSFQGIRFSKGKQKVEAVIGLPCNQVAVVFNDGKTSQWWTGVLKTKIANQVLGLMKEEAAKK